ncbi:hypothetical protein [Eudoraea sp.]|uniref:hypothetical protein n=1 Tax=Eudoraea sp. TaxID=1979955 RepID=UPI003C7874BA
MEQLKFQRLKKESQSPINLNPGMIIAIIVYFSFLGMSYMNNQIFMDKLLVIGAILGCISFIKVMNKTN